eukprot:4507542-Amphidinium_carterae.1
MVERWKRSHQLLHDPYSTRAHRYVSGKCQVTPFRGLMLNDQFVTDSQSVDAQLRTTWKQLHRLRNTDPYEVMRQFEKKYATLVPRKENAPLQPLTADDFIRALKRTKIHTAAGPCGWRANELKKLPAQAWQQLATLFNEAELQGALPRLCQLIWQTPIPKGEQKITATDVRPISVYSVVYRLYAKARYATIKGLFSAMVHDHQYG